MGLIEIRADFYLLVFFRSFLAKAIKDCRTDARGFWKLKRHLGKRSRGQTATFCLAMSGTLLTVIAETLFKPFKSFNRFAQFKPLRREQIGSRFFRNARLAA